MESLVTCRINIMISDMEAAISFYTDILGLSLENRYGDHYAEVRAPDLLIGLHPKSDKTVYGDNMSVGFGVTAFDTVVEHLRARQVDCRVEQDGWIRLAYFTDPDQNVLFIAERNS